MAGFVNKVKNFFNNNVDEDYDEEYDYTDDLDEDMYQDEENNTYDDDDDDDDYSTEDISSFSRSSKSERRKRRPVRESTNTRINNYEEYSPNARVVNINATAKLQVVFYKPERFSEEIKQSADELLKNHTVVLNLETTNKDQARRIIDFFSGLSYAQKGKVRKIATSTYIVIPSNVDISGEDLLEELESNGFIGN